MEKDDGIELSATAVGRFWNLEPGPPAGSAFRVTQFGRVTCFGGFFQHFSISVRGGGGDSGGDFGGHVIDSKRLCKSQFSQKHWAYPYILYSTPSPSPSLQTCKLKRAVACPHPHAWVPRRGREGGK